MSLRKEIQDLHEFVKPETPKALVILVDKNQNIVEIQGLDVTNCTDEEINIIMNSAPIHYYLPLPDLEKEKS